MTLATADFETGVNGASISTGDTGSAAAWDFLQVGGAGSSLKYDTAHVAHGSLAAKLVNATSSTTYLYWGAKIGTLTEHWGRFYFYTAALPGSNVPIVVFNPSGTAFNLSLNASGTIATSLGGGNTGGALLAAQYNRVEYYILNDVSSGVVTVKVFQDADSITPTSVTTLFGGNTQANVTEITYGNIGDSGGARTWWYDQLVAGATAYPGPYPVSTTAPTIAGSTAVGSTLFCDGGTWNYGAQFTPSFQWTRAGVNIGGATSASYTTVNADGGQILRCVATATGLVATNESSSATSNAIAVTGGASGLSSGVNGSVLVLADILRW